MKNTKPFIVKDKKAKDTKYYVLYANETKAKEFDTNKDAKQFKKELNGKK